MLLVGAEVWPNYFAICAFKPQRIVLVCSDRTTGPARRLAAATTSLAYVREMDTIMVEDAFSTTECQQALAAHPWLSPETDWTLVFTGGTAPMSVGAARAHDAGSQSQDRCCCIDLGGRVRFDDGTEASIVAGDGVTLDRDAVAELAGVAFPREDKNHALIAGMTLDQLAIVGRARLAAADETSDDFAARAVTEDRFGVLRDWAPEAKWHKIFKDHWLEAFVVRIAERVAAEDPETHYTIIANPLIGTPGTSLRESDVMVIVEDRVHLISCTTAAKRAETIQKHDEVRVRARRLGGPFAGRPALVCLTDNADVVSHQRELWRTPTALPVFGRSSVSRWLEADFDDFGSWLRGDPWPGPGA